LKGTDFRGVTSGLVVIIEWQAITPDSSVDIIPFPPSHLRVSQVQRFPLPNRRLSV
jgi:hypothetical protein